MKCILTSTLFLFALIAHAFAQVPQGFSYQAVARDSAGECLSNTLISLQISILEGSSTGMELYKEEFNNIQTNEVGLFQLQIGNGTPQGSSPNFADVSWYPSDLSRYLMIDLAPDNSNNFIHVGTTQLLTVPYAMATDEAGHAHSADTTTYAQHAANGIQTDSIGFENLSWHGSNGSLNGVLGVNGITQDNGSIRLYDDQSNVRALLTADELAGGEDVGALSLYGNNASLNLSLGINGSHGPDRGAMSLRDDAGLSKIWALVNSDNEGVIQTYGPNGEQNVLIRSTGGGTYDHGLIQIKDDTGAVAIDMRSHGASDGAGRLRLNGANGNANIDLGVLGVANPNKGMIRIFGENGTIKISSGVKAGDIGFSQYFGANGNLNVVISDEPFQTNQQENHGFVGVMDSSGTRQASIYTVLFAGNSTGIVEGDVKNFVMDHPSSPNKEIVYTSLEGPEVAAYERGTAQLVNGEAEVQFSETFEIVANPTTLTVMTSPWSAHAKGLAIVERTATGFKVKELGNGSGNYQFDWEAKAVRKGYETFPVIREKTAPTAILGEFEER